MEIERKYLIHHIPENLTVTETHHIEQGYLCTGPVVRIRKDNEDYIPVSYTHLDVYKRQG